MDVAAINKKEAHEYCARLDEFLTKIEHTLNDPYNFTYEAIKALKDIVQLKGEEMKMVIDNKMNHFINKLDEYNDECKKSFKLKEYLVKAEKFRLEKEEGRQMLAQYLSNLNNDFFELYDNDQWLRCKNETKEALDRFENALDLFKQDLLLQKFNNHQKEIKEYFGYFEIDEQFYLISAMPFNSKIVPNIFRQEDLLKLCEFKEKQEMSLLYRGSLHGFGSVDFHAKCDYKERTLTVIKALESGNIFGGYTDVKWDKSYSYKIDKNAFLFSFVNKAGKPVKVPIKSGFEERAIYCTPKCGPCFGEGIDICIYDNARNTSENYTSFGNSYVLSNMDDALKKDRCFLAGFPTFTVEEIEVFQLK